MPKTTLLMLLTPPEIPIARYTIPALCQLTKINDVDVLIYLNGLNLAEENEVIQFAEGVNGIHFKSNRNRLENINASMVPGEYYITDAGRKELRVGIYESCGEAWERELLLLNSELVGIIDADLEVFDGGFLDDIIKSFAIDSTLGFMSVDYDPTKPVYDSYSDSKCILWQRYHTWFCVYSRQALDVYSDCSYKEEDCDGVVIKYDHFAFLQKQLMNKFGYHGDVIQDKWRRYAYLHYTAFAQNRSLKAFWLTIYRIIRIGRHNGFYHLHKKLWLVLPIRRLSAVMYKALLLKRYDRERSRYRWMD